MATKHFKTNTRQVNSWVQEGIAATHASCAVTHMSTLLNEHEALLSSDEYERIKRAYNALNAVTRRLGDVMTAISNTAQVQSL